MSDKLGSYASQWYSAFVSGRGDKREIKDRLQAEINDDPAFALVVQTRIAELKKLLAARKKGCFTEGIEEKLYGDLLF